MAERKTAAKGNQDKKSGKFVKGNTAASRKTPEQEIAEYSAAMEETPETKDAVRKYAQAKALNALKIADQIMRSKDARPADKLKCVEIILAHAYGKPGTSIDDGATDVKISMEGLEEYAK